MRLDGAVCKSCSGATRTGHMGHEIFVCNKCMSGKGSPIVRAELTNGNNVYWPNGQPSFYGMVSYGSMARYQAC